MYEHARGYLQHNTQRLQRVKLRFASMTPSQKAHQVPAVNATYKPARLNLCPSDHNRNLT